MVLKKLRRNRPPVMNASQSETRKKNDFQFSWFGVYLETRKTNKGVNTKRENWTVSRWPEDCDKSKEMDGTD